MSDGVYFYNYPFILPSTSFILFLFFRSFVHSFIHSFIHSFDHSLNNTNMYSHYSLFLLSIITPKSSYLKLLSINGKNITVTNQNNPNYRRYGISRMRDIMGAIFSGFYRDIMGAIFSGFYSSRYHDKVPELDCFHKWSNTRQDTAVQLRGEVQWFCITYAFKY